VNIEVGVPQIIYIFISLLALGISLQRHGYTDEIHFGQTLVSTMITFGLLFWGGFFG
jgi:hypothetical protein